MHKFHYPKRLPAKVRPPAPPRRHPAVPARGWWLPLLALTMAICPALMLAACEGTEGKDFSFQGVETTNLDFNAEVQVGVGNSPITMASGDFDGDTNVDLAVVNRFETVPAGQSANPGAPGTITILSNDGAGNFTFSSEFPVGVLPGAVIAQDVSGDGRPDLVLLNATASTVSVFINDGAGGFPTQADLDFSGLATQVSLVDLNGTSPAAPDIVVSVPVVSDPLDIFAPGVIAVFLNGGAGVFPALPSTTTSLGATNDVSTPTRFVSGNFDGGANQDLAVINVSQNNVAILLGDGLGGFTPAAAPTVATGTGPFDIVADLFDAGTDLDLMVTNGLSVTASFLPGDGAGAFDGLAPGSPFALGGLGGLPERMVTGNFTAAGLDVAVVGSGGEVVSLLDGDGAGTFVAAVTGVGREPFAINKGDFDVDGDLDLVVPEGEFRRVVILAGDGAGAFTSSQVGFDTRTTFPTVLDVNGDGLDDLLLLHPGFDRVVVLINCHPAIMTPC